jgi:glycosyltransferase involved in cell wall biosynthesis
MLERRSTSLNNETPLVSVVFVTYNRPYTLVAAYESFLALTDYPRDRLELIVADDGSDLDAQDFIRRMEFDVHVLAARNRGLGANMNQGARAATGEMILVLQDDWLCVGPSDYLRRCVSLLSAHPDIGIVLVRDWGEHAAQERRAAPGGEACILAPRDASGAPARVYTDNPHLKRRDFHEAVGWYAEGVAMTEMEDRMNAAVGAQSRYRAALFPGMKPFVHIGDRYSFNPGRRRAALEQAALRLPGGREALRLAKSCRRWARQWRGREGM